jgi:4-amino-4-deoxy-L-arabinose transferase-like glycosyltransferase
MPALRLSNRSPLALTGWLLTAAIIAFRLLPGLARPGMFFDGVTHAAIARNMAAGTGDFWHPVFSPADGAGYHEQPPLGFWLESLFFRALGDHFWVEKLFSAVIALATAAAIAAIWRRLAGERAELRNLDWLPVALWAAMPGWGWMFGNNMLENTLGLFTTLAVYAILRASDTRGSTSHVARRSLCLALGAACIVAGVLSKGPVGLFPLATPLAMCIAFPNGRGSMGMRGPDCNGRHRIQSCLA